MTIYSTDKVHGQELRQQGESGMHPDTFCSKAHDHAFENISAANDRPLTGAAPRGLGPNGDGPGHHAHGAGSDASATVGPATGSTKAPN